MKISVFFSHAYQPLHNEVLKKLSPLERGYGIAEMEQRGHIVKIHDSRFQGWSKKISFAFKKYGFNFVRPLDIYKATKADVIYVKDSFCLALTIASRLTQTPIIYCDSMTHLPRSRLRKAYIKLNLQWCSKVICYSSTQKQLWDEHFQLGKSKIHFINYGIDIDYYLARTHPKEPTNTFLLLSVGRDPGREYATLQHVIKHCGINTTLVVPPYLLPSGIARDSSVRLLQNISYDDLFNLYSVSTLALIPLKKGITYPSGIRALLEAILTDTPVLVPSNPYLEEMFKDKHNILFYKAECYESLVDKIEWAKSHPESLKNIRTNAKKTVQEHFAHNILVNNILDIVEKA